MRALLFDSCAVQYGASGSKSVESITSGVSKFVVEPLSIWELVAPLVNTTADAEKLVGARKAAEFLLSVDAHVCETPSYIGSELRLESPGDVHPTARSRSLRSFGPLHKLVQSVSRGQPLRQRDSQAFERVRLEKADAVTMVRSVGGGAVAWAKEVGTRSPVDWGSSLSLNLLTRLAEHVLIGMFPKQVAVWGLRLDKIVRMAAFEPQSLPYFSGVLRANAVLHWYANSEVSGRNVNDVRIAARSFLFDGVVTGDRGFQKLVNRWFAPSACHLVSPPD